MLLVENDPRARARMASWLEDRFDVMVCPGPDGPDYSCIGGRTERCPLAEGADIVVVNLHLASDAAMCGTPGWHLLTTYFSMGKQVIALADQSDPVRPTPDDHVQVLRRPVERGELLDAVEEARARMTQAAR